MFANSFRDLPGLMIFALVIAGLTVLAVVTFGRMIAKRNRLLALLACSVVAPGVLLAYGAYMLQTSNGPPPNDWGAMAFIACVALATLSLPVSFATSGLMIFWRRKPG
jgi:CDP-diglyceride synthetase